MAERPSYEELAQRLKELEKEASACRHAAQALKRGVQEKTAILDSLLEHVVYQDTEMNVVWANQAACNSVGMTRENLVGRHCYEVWADRQSPCQDCPVAKARESGKPQTVEKMTPNGRWWYIRGHPLRDDSGEIVGMSELTLDITERKEAEFALRAAHDRLQQRVEERTHELLSRNEQLKLEIKERKQAEKQIRALSHQLLQAQEVERKKLAYDLHDHLAQDLSALKIAFDTFCDRHQEISTGARQRMSELSEKLHGVILAVRDLAYNLRPPSLDEAGLVNALDEYCEEYSSKNELEIEFLPVGLHESKLDFETKITLYRLAQEALNNVRKHADASHVSIRLVPSFPNIILRIEDDGRGFDVAARLAAAHYEKRMGLVGMKERVALLGGTMEIQSRLAQGTKIVVELPYGGTYHDKYEDHANR